MVWNIIYHIDPISHQCSKIRLVNCTLTLATHLSVSLTVSPTLASVACEPTSAKFSKVSPDEFLELYP